MVLAQDKLIPNIAAAMTVVIQNMQAAQAQDHGFIAVVVMVKMLETSKNQLLMATAQQQAAAEALVIYLENL